MTSPENPQDAPQPDASTPEPFTASSTSAEPQGGAGMADEGAPVGFTADVGGTPGMTDDPDEAAAAACTSAGAHSRPTASEANEAAEGSREG